VYGVEMLKIPNKQIKSSTENRETRKVKKPLLMPAVVCWL
jgi:hypothetical protein